MKDMLVEFNVLKWLIKESNKKNPKKRNVIIENINGDQFATNVSIGYMKDFDFFGQRKHIKERIKNTLNPINIRRITFLINNETVEFVRCQ